MKYSLECLDRAIVILLPESPKWHKSINRPTLIDIAAKQVFMYPEKFEDIDSAFAIIVIRAAMLDLSTLGWFTFGDADTLA